MPPNKTHVEDDQHLEGLLAPAERLEDALSLGFKMSLVLDCAIEVEIQMTAGSILRRGLRDTLTSLASTDSSLRTIALGDDLWRTGVSLSQRTH